MMDAIKLIWFESKKQITSFPFIITLVLLTVFSFTQMSEVFHIPVNSESDIQALDRAGERDFIDVSNTDEELKEKTSQYLEQMIDLPAFLGAVFLQRLACRRFPGPALARAAPAALRVLWFRRALRRALLRVLRQVALRQRGVKGSQPA